MTYDVHAHCIPLGLLDTLATDPGYDIEIHEQNGRRTALIAGRVATGPLRPDLVDVDARVAAMDAARVRTQLLSSWIDLTAYALNPAAGARYARMFNEALAATVALHPDRFLGLATVPLQAPEAAAAELRYAVGELGMVGVEIATTIAGVELDDPGLDPFWAAAEELRCLILVHPLDSLAGRSLSRYFLGNLVGNPAETTIAVAHLVFGGVLERFEDLQICLVHGGGFLPYQRGRLDRGYRAKGSMTATHLTRPPSAWLRRLYYDTVTHEAEAIAFLVDFAGVDRVVLGSDYPFEMGDPQPVATLEAVPGLSEADRDAILRGNVQRIIDGLKR